MKAPKKVHNDKFHSIFTVILLDGYEDENGIDLSTVSFEKFEDAVEYCLSQIGDDSARVREELCTQMYYNDGNTKYYLEEANLIH